MRKFLFSIALFLLTLGCFSQTNYEKLKQVAIDKGYQIVTEKYADLAQGETASASMQFYPGYNYIIIGLSDDSDVEDVDLFVNYTDGTEGLKDDEDSPIAYIEFHMTGNFREMNVIIKNYKSKSPSYNSKCRFFVAASKVSSLTRRNSNGHSSGKKAGVQKSQTKKCPLVIPKF